MALDATAGNCAGKPDAYWADRGHYRVSRPVRSTCSIVFIRLFISGDDDYALSSGQVSPICKCISIHFLSQNPHPIALDWSGEHQTAISSSPFDRLHSNIPTAASSFVNISEYDRKVNEFDQKRPHARSTGNRIVTWSDPMSIRGHIGRTESSSDGYGTETTWGDLSEMPFGGGENWTRKRLISSQLQR